MENNLNFDFQDGTLRVLIAGEIGHSTAGVKKLIKIEK